MPLGVHVSQLSCIGARSRNEDCLGVEQHDGHWCLVLCDGAGGHRDGAVAARVAVDRVLEGFRGRPPVDPADLSELLLDAHDAVLAAQRAHGADQPAAAMYATVVTLVIDTAAGRALWGHVGDSRLYRWRAGQLAEITRDDSVLQAMIDAGVVDPANPPKMAQHGVLLAALGSGDEIAPHVSNALPLQPADAFLLCSDGWWGGLGAETIARLLGESADPQDWLERMRQATVQRADPRQDNHSAIACWIGAPAPAGAAA